MVIRPVTYLAIFGLLIQAQAWACPDLSGSPTARETAGLSNW